MEITVIGDTTLDLVSEQVSKLPKEDTELLTKFTPKLGGQAAHCALALAELGVKVTFITCIADGNEKIIKKLNKCKLKLQKGKDSAMSVIIPTPSKRTIINQKGANSELKYKNKIKTKYVFIGGFWHIPKFNVEKCLKEAKDATVFMDVGYNEKAKVSKLKKTLKYVDYFFADEKELMLYHNAQSLEHVFQKVDCVLGIHMGKRGSAVYDHGKLEVSRIISKYSGETTGAGDYWNAGFIYGTMKNWSDKKKLDFANKFTIKMLKKNIHKL